MQPKEISQLLETACEAKERSGDNSVRHNSDMLHSIKGRVLF